MKSCPQCAHPLSADDTQQCPECGFDLSLRADETLKDTPDQDSSSSTVRNPTLRDDVSKTDTIKLEDDSPQSKSAQTIREDLPSAGAKNTVVIDEDDELFDDDNHATVIEDSDSADAPAVASDKTVRESPPPPAPTIISQIDDDDDLFGSDSDTTVVEKPGANDGNTILVDAMQTMSRPANRSDSAPTLPPPAQEKSSQSDQPNSGELASTLIAGTEPTIVNPQAAQAAAEAYSRGLNTLIPPRTMVRKEESPDNSDYQIEKKLGAGAFGVVFRATQTPLERSVAIKILQNKSDDVVQQTRVKNEFLREAQFTGRLEHPNIVPIHDIGLTVSPSGNVNPFYVMKEIRGQSWHKEIRKQSLGDNLSVFKNVVNAIGFAHSQGILHCDLKPDNVMIGEFGEVLVVDWGQAVDLSNPDTMRPGGTPAYISPEMAQYWIDIYMDRKSESPSRKDVGQRSDIYLLGAILFEIVAGHPPHCRAANESPYDVIGKAAKNYIVPHNNEADQELMQIALSALRATDQPHIETVESLQTAIEDYDNRSLSIDLRRRADELLDRAKKQADYDNYQRARFGYEEAIQKWPNNELAISGLKDARLSCAQQALSDQNFDLGLDMLTGAEGKDESDVRDALTEGKRVRDRRKKWIAGLSIGLAGSILLGILINGYMIRKNLESIAARDYAVLQKKEAIEDKARIEDSIAPLRAEAEQNQAIIAEFPEKLAGEQRKFETEKKNLEQKMDLEIATFNREKDALVQQKKQLVGQNSQLLESSQLLRYKGKLNQVVENLQVGNFRETRKLLDDFKNQNSFEIERLNLLAHREIDSLYPKQPLVSVAAAADGSLLAIAFDNRIELREPAALNQVIASIPIRHPNTIRLSPDGSTLAIGQPSDSPLTAGSVTLVDIKSPLDESKQRQFEAQSQSIDSLAFSQNGVLLSLGKVSKLRQSSASGLEEPLMAWNADGQRLEIDLVLPDGSKPKFDSATLSDDGDRILLTNQSGLDRDQSAHVFQRSINRYRWLATCPASGISTAVFADDAGSFVIVSRRNSGTGDYDLARWTIGVDGNADTPQFQPQLSTIAPLPDSITSMDRQGDFLVATGGDRQTIVWDLQSNQNRTLRGHTRPADVCFLRPGDSLEQCQITTAVTGESPEVFVTTLANYRQEYQRRPTGWTAKDQPASVTCIFRHESKKQSLEAFGNDQGMVSIINNGKTIRRNVSAWKSHAVSKPYVFAQSASDHFYKFDRDSGELLKILTKIGDGRPSTQRVASLQVSANGKIGLIQTDSQQPTFELWDLENESLIRTVNYGEQDLFGNGSQKQLTKFAISSDGRWVVGGKVSVFAWQVADGKLVRFKRDRATAARSNVNSIAFVNQSNQFLVSWRKRIDRFDLLNPLAAGTFVAECVSDDQNRQNIFDAQLTGDGIRFLANNKDANGINLVEFGDNQPIATFPQASFASFQPNASDLPAAVVAAGDLTSDSPVVFRWENGVTTQFNFADVANKVGASRVNKFERVYAAADGKLLFQTTSRDKEAVGRIWHTFSVETQGRSVSLSNLRIFGEPEIAAVVTDGQRIGTLSDATVRIWKLGEQSLQPAGILHGEYSAIDLSTDGQRLAAATTNQRLQIIDFSTLETIADLEMPATVSSSPTAVAWRPDGSGLAVAVDGGTIVEFMPGADGRLHGPGKTIQTVNSTPSPERFDSLAFAADANTVLATSTASSSALVFHRQPGDNHEFVVTPLAYDDGQSIVSADLSADGNRVVAGTSAGRIAIWNSEPLSKKAISAGAMTSVAERELLLMPNLHQSAISAIRFVEREHETGVLSAESESGQNEVLFWPAKAANRPDKE